MDIEKKNRIAHKQKRDEIEKLYKHLMDGANFLYQQKKKAIDVELYFRNQLLFYRSQKLQSNVYDLGVFLEGYDGLFYFEHAKRPVVKGIYIDHVIKLFMHQWKESLPEDDTLCKLHFIYY